MAGGTLLDKELSPQFGSEAGEWALGLLKDLYKSSPPEIPDWHYDEVAQCFRNAKAAMTTDWPGSFATYKDPTFSKVADKFAVAIYPVGPTGKRYVYAGGFSYAIPKSCKDRQGALALMRFLLSVHPLGRIGTIEECGRVALFLATEDSSFMTGSIVTVDGGVTLGY